MSWQVQVAEEAEAFFEGLTDDEFAKVDAAVELLRQFGPALGRPYADSVYGSRHSNLKELRIKMSGKEFRILFAFDPKRSAVLLVGGDKGGDKRWYRTFIEHADAAFDLHLATLTPTSRKDE